EPPFLDLQAAEWVARDRYEIRPDARRFENWECNYAGKIGLGVAIDYALGWGLDNINERITLLAGNLRNRLTDLPGVKVRDLGTAPCGIVTFNAEGKAAEDIQTQLAEQKINVSVSIAPSTRIDAEMRHLPPLVRASVHYYNSEAEVERFCDVL